MYRITVTYGHPADQAAFDAHYDSVHQPLAAALPGLRAFTTCRAEALPGDPEPGHYLQAQLDFDDRDAALAAFGSPAGQAAGADVATFATGGATLTGGEVADRLAGVGA